MAERITGRLPRAWNGVVEWTWVERVGSGHEQPPVRRVPDEAPDAGSAAGRGWQRLWRDLNRD